ncbi:MAG: hypothetical protein R3F61_29305 [Myxococcota bacterium]
MAHRHLKLLAPEHVVYADTPFDAVDVEAEDRKGVVRTLEHDRMEDRSGRVLQRPAEVGIRDTLVLTPLEPDTELRLWVRGTGLFDRSGFQQVRAVTGGLDRRFANEIVFLPMDEPLTGALRLPIRHFDTPFDGYSFSDGDLLLVEAVRPEGDTERTLLVRRDAGPTFDGFAGVLITLPHGNEGGQQGVSPILAAGPTFGWHTRKASGPGRVLDTMELVISFGIGSTALDVVDLDSELSGLFDSALAGAGVRMFRVFTVQGFVNTSRFFREQLEAPTTIALGLDAAGLAALTRNAGSRLFRRNPVSGDDR